MKKFLASALIVGLCSGVSFAHDSDMHGMMDSKMTKEQREKMAVSHEKMAVCLRSDKPMKECHEEMMKACTDTMGADACPMMGHHKKMMHSDKKEKSESKE